MKIIKKGFCVVTNISSMNPKIILETMSNTDEDAIQKAINMELFLGEWDDYTQKFDADVVWTKIKIKWSL